MANVGMKDADKMLHEDELRHVLVSTDAAGALGIAPPDVHPAIPADQRKAATGRPRMRYEMTYTSDETYGLTPAQQQNCVDSFFYRSANSWADLNAEQRKEAALQWMKIHRPEDVPLKAIGLSEKQIRQFSVNLVETVQAMLPDLVAPLVKRALTEALKTGFDLDEKDVALVAEKVMDQLPGARDVAAMKRENDAMKRELATLRSQVLQTLTVKTSGGQSAAATVAGPADDGAVAALRREVSELKASSESAQRQLERHSSHLGTLETKVQKLRGGDR